MSNLHSSLHSTRKNSLKTKKKVVLNNKDNVIQFINKLEKKKLYLNFGML